MRVWSLLLGILVAGTVHAEAMPAQRIIALSPHAVELLFTLGAGDRIVGTVEYADYPEAAKAIPRIGSYHGIQIEQVVALAPDLIVAWKSGNKVADLEKLSSLGFSLFYTHPRNIPQIGEDLKQLGALTGHTKEAEKAAADLNQRYEKIRTQYANQQPVRVFYQLWHDPLRTVGEGSWINTLIEDCGGQNLFATAESDYPLVAMASVITKNPEVIVVPHHSGSVGAKVEIWKNWPEVDAVRNQRIHTLHGDLLHRYTVRALEGLTQLCEVIDQARRSAPR